MAYQLGLDTGGTYTDAVLIDDEQNVVASSKSLTSHGDLIQGLRNAASAVLSPTHQPITLVSLSTTLATNALVEGRGRPVCLVLIGYRPEQLKRARLNDALAGDPHGFIDGGHTASGEPACELDVSALTQLIKSVDESVDAYAVSALFAVRNPNHERQAQRLIAKLTGKPVSCGHALSNGLDAPRRALTALLNARLIPMITALLSASKQLLLEHEVVAPLMVVKGDGSLVSASLAEESPVETILSGPAASVIGAQFLCKEPLLVVSDMGGTTTDIALVRNGRPKLNPDGATVGGWRTMVEAIDVRTFGLGGDSRIGFDRERRVFSVGPERVIPLSLLIMQYPALIKDLQDQLELPRSTTHSAEFVMAHAAVPSDLTAQQMELWERIKEQPMAVQSLFSDQTLDRALVRLIQRGIVIRSGFTPTDACHVLGELTTWDTKAALLGAQLLMRYSDANLGATYKSPEEFAQQIKEEVARLSALAIVETQASDQPGLQSRFDKQLSDSQKTLLYNTFNPDGFQELKFHVELALPVIGLGAPAASYYPRVCKLLNTQAVLSNQGSVANALGAVIGTVKQQQEVVITPSGGTAVNVHFPDGTEYFDELEAAASSAIAWAREAAKYKALQAGASDINITHTREDNIVENQGDSVFFESTIIATAAGRPSVLLKSK